MVDDGGLAQARKRFDDAKSKADRISAMAQHSKSVLMKEINSMRVMIAEMVSDSERETVLAEPPKDLAARARRMADECDSDAGKHLSEAVAAIADLETALAGEG